MTVTSQAEVLVSTVRQAGSTKVGCDVMVRDLVGLGKSSGIGTGWIRTDGLEQAAAESCGTGRLKGKAQR